jgi:probable F420-dependent oxidoreductase
MSEISTLESVTPGISVQVMNFAAQDPGPGGWQPMLDTARACDVAGIDRVVVSDHVVSGEDLEAYGDPKVGGIKGGVQPTDSDGHWLEPLTALSVIAGATTRVRLHTGILIAALRRPVTLAKALSTLDVLSCGRVDLGVGVGWQKEEYFAAGLPFEGRGKLLNHTLEVCQTFWREQRASYDDHGLKFEATHMMPKPLQPGGVPFWVSGTINKMVLDRIARFGSGWIPWGDDQADIASGVARVREALEAAGRETRGFQVTGYLPMQKGEGGIDLERSMEAVPGMVEAGVTDFRVMLPIPAELDAATDYLSSVVAIFRKAAGR